MENISKYGKFVKGSGLGSFFFSATLPDFQLLQEAATRLTDPQGKGQTWLLGAALGARGGSWAAMEPSPLRRVGTETALSPWCQESIFQGNSRNTWNASVY